GLKTKLSAELSGDDSGVVGMLMKLSQVLSSAPEGQVLLDLVKMFTGMAHVEIPTQLPLGDGLQAADNSLRVLGGMMALDSILLESERLTVAMAAHLS